MIPLANSSRQNSSNVPASVNNNDSNRRPQTYVVKTLQVASEVLTVSTQKLIESCQKEISVQTIVEATDELTTSESQSKAKTPRDLATVGSRFNWYARWVNPTEKLKSSLVDAKDKNRCTEVTKQDIEQIIKITTAFTKQTLGIIFSDFVCKVDDRKHPIMALKCLYYLSKNRIDISNPGLESILESLRINTDYLKKLNPEELRWYNPVGTIRVYAEMMIALKSFAWQLLILSHAIQYMHYQWPSDVGKLIDQGLSLMSSNEKYYLEAMVAAIAAKAKLGQELTSSDLLTLKKALIEVSKGKSHLLYKPEEHKQGEGEQWGWSLSYNGKVSNLLNVAANEKLLSNSDFQMLLSTYNEKVDKSIRGKILKTLQLASQNGQWNFQAKDRLIEILKLTLSDADFKIRNRSLVIGSTLAINCDQSGGAFQQEFACGRHLQEKWSLRALKDYIVLCDKAQMIAQDLDWKDLLTAIKEDTKRRDSLRNEALYLLYLIEKQPEHIEALLSDEKKQWIATKQYLTLVEAKQQIDSGVIFKLFEILKGISTKVSTRINIILIFRHLIDYQKISPEVAQYVADSISGYPLKLRKICFRFLSATISQAGNQTESIISEALINRIREDLKEKELFRDTITFVDRCFSEDNLQHPHILLQNLIDFMQNDRNVVLLADNEQFLYIVIYLKSVFLNYSIPNALYGALIEVCYNTSNKNTKHLVVRLFFNLIDKGDIVDWNRDLFDFLVEQSSSTGDQENIDTEQQEAMSSELGSDRSLVEKQGDSESMDTEIAPSEYTLGALCRYIQIIASRIPPEAIENLFRLLTEDTGELAILHAFESLVENRVVLQDSIVCQLSNCLVKKQYECQLAFANLLKGIGMYQKLPLESIDHVIEATGSEDQVVVMTCLEILNPAEINVSTDEPEIFENSVFCLFKLVEKDYLNPEIRLKGLELIYSYSRKGVTFPQHLTKLGLLAEDVEISIRKKSIQILTSQIRQLKTAIDADLLFCIKECTYPLLKIEDLQRETIDLWYELGKIHKTNETFFSTRQLDTTAKTAYREYSFNTLKVTQKLLKFFPRQLSFNAQNLLFMIQISMNLGDERYTITDDIQALNFLKEQIEGGRAILPSHYKAVEKAIYRFNGYNFSREGSESCEIKEGGQTRVDFLESLFSFYSIIIGTMDLPLEGMLRGMCEISDEKLDQSYSLRRSRLIARTLVNHYSIDDSAVRILEEGFVLEGPGEEWNVLYLKAITNLVNRGTLLSENAMEKIWNLLLAIPGEAVKLCAAEILVKQLAMGKWLEIFDENTVDRLSKLSEECDFKALQNQYKILIFELRKRLPLSRSQLEEIYQEILSTDLLDEQWEKCEILQRNCSTLVIENPFLERDRFTIDKQSVFSAERIMSDDFEIQNKRAVHLQREQHLNHKYLLMVELKREEKKFVQDLKIMIEQNSFIEINEKMSSLRSLVCSLINVDRDIRQIESQECGMQLESGVGKNRYYSLSLYSLIEESLFICHESDKDRLLCVVENIGHRMPLTESILTVMISFRWISYSQRVFEMLHHYILSTGKLTDTLIQDLKEIVVKELNAERNFYAYLCLRAYQKLPKEVSTLVELEHYPQFVEDDMTIEYTLEDFFLILPVKSTSLTVKTLDSDWLRHLHQFVLGGGWLSIRNSDHLLKFLEWIPSTSLTGDVEFTDQIQMILDIFERAILGLPIAISSRLFKACFHLSENNLDNRSFQRYQAIISKILEYNQLSKETSFHVYEMLAHQLKKASRIKPSQLFFIEMLAKHLNVSISQDILPLIMNFILNTSDPELAVKATCFLHNQLIIAGAWPKSLVELIHRMIQTFFPEQAPLNYIESEQPSLLSRFFSSFRSRTVQIPPTYPTIRFLIENLLSYALRDRRIEVLYHQPLQSLISNSELSEKLVEANPSQSELREVLQGYNKNLELHWWIHIFILKQHEFRLTGEEMLEFIHMISYCLKTHSEETHSSTIVNKHGWIKNLQELKDEFFRSLLLPYRFSQTVSEEQLTVSEEQLKKLYVKAESLKWDVDFRKRFFEAFSTEKTTVEPLLDLLNFICDEQLEMDQISSYLEGCDRETVTPRVLKKKLSETILWGDLASLIDVELDHPFLVQQKRLRAESIVENGCSLSQNGWNFLNLKQWVAAIVKTTDSQSSSECLEELDKLFSFLRSYRHLISEDDFYSLSIAEEGKTPNLLESIYQKILEEYLTPNNQEKDLKELLEELQVNEINQKDRVLLDIFKDDSLKEMFAQVEELYSKNERELKLRKRNVISKWVSSSRIKDWNRDNISRWSSKLKKLIRLKNPAEKELLPECLAVFKRACYLTFKHEPRTVQLLAVTILIERADPGIIAQISTGEGKSLIIAMLAVLKALQGEYVDVITSSSDLAERDVKNFEDFYLLFGLTVATNRDINYQTGPKSCYQKRIVYGNPSDFEFDVLRQEYCLLKTRQIDNKSVRDYAFVILDEVDNVLVEGNEHLTMISTPLPLMGELTPLFLLIWTELQNLRAIVKANKKEGNATVESEIDLAQHHLDEVEGELMIELNAALPGIDRIDLSNPIEVETFICTKLSSYVKKLIRGQETTIFVPEHLKSFIDNQTDIWIRNAWHASEVYKEGIHYVIKKNREKGDIIVPVDFENTGSLLINTTLGDAMHQFLQIKHSLTVEPFSIVTNYLSTYAFIRRYKRKIGITGTIGSSGLQELYKRMYRFSSIQVPSFLPTTRKTLTPILRENTREWMEAIINSTIRESSLGKVVLIICENIDAANNIISSLSNRETELKIFKYVDDTVDNKVVFNAKMGKGKVIVATNLAGRGFDVRLEDQVICRGGLHVVVSFLPKNSRIQEQAFGRASRRGEPGTVQLILDREEIDRTIHLTPEEKEELDVDPTRIVAIRDSRERDKLWDIENIQHPKIEKQTELFSEYLKLLQEVLSREEIKRKTSFLEKCGERMGLARRANAIFLEQKIMVRRAALEEKWGLWLKEVQRQAIDDTTLAAFHAFKKDILEAILTDDFIENPVHFISLGNALINKAANYREVFTRKFLYKHALDAYEKAISLDPIFAYNAYYHKAFAILSMKEGHCLEKAGQELTGMIKAIEGPYEQLRMTIAYYENETDDRSQKKRANLCDKLNEVLQVYYLLIEAAENNIRQIKSLQKFVDVRSLIPSLSKIPYKKYTFSEFRADLLQDLNDSWEEQIRCNREFLVGDQSQGFIRINFHGLKTYTNDMRTNSELINVVNNLSSEVKVNLTFDSGSLYSERGGKEGLRALLPINKNGLKEEGALSGRQLTQTKTLQAPQQNTSMKVKSSSKFRRKRTLTFALQNQKKSKPLPQKVEDLLVKLTLSGLGAENLNAVLGLLIGQTLIRMSIGPLKLNQERLSSVRAKMPHLKVSVWFPGQKDSQPRIVSICDQLLDNEDGEITLLNCTIEQTNRIKEELTHESGHLSINLSHIDQNLADDLLKDQTIASSLHFERLSKSLALELLNATLHEHNGATLSLDFVEFADLEKSIKGTAENNLFTVNHRLISSDLAEINQSRAFIDHYRLNGYYYLFSVGEDLPRPKAGLAFLAAMSVAQVAAGIALTTFSGGLLIHVGGGLVNEGIGDTTRFFTALINNEANINQYLKDKTISIGISLTCAGFSQIKKVKELIDKGGKAASMALEYSDEAIQAMSRSRKVLTSTGKATIQVTKNAIKSFGGKAIDSGGELLVSTHAETFADQIEKVLIDLFNKRIWDDRLRVLFAVDEFLKSDHRRVDIKDTVKELLLKGAESIVYTSVLDTAELSTFEREFAQAIKERYEKSRDFRPLLSERIRDLLSKEKDFNDICEWLMEKKILTSDGVIDPLGLNQFLDSGLQGAQNKTFCRDISSYNLQEFACCKNSEVRKKVLESCLEYLQKLSKDYFSEKQKLILHIKLLLKEISSERLQSKANLISSCCKQAVEMAVDRAADHACDKLDESSKQAASGKKNKPTKERKAKGGKERGKSKAKQASKRSTKSSRTAQKRSSLKDKKIRPIKSSQSVLPSKAKTSKDDSPKKQQDESPKKENNWQGYAKRAGKGTLSASNQHFRNQSIHQTSHQGRSQSLFLEKFALIKRKRQAENYASALTNHTKNIKRDIGAILIHGGVDDENKREEEVLSLFQISLEQHRRGIDPNPIRLMGIVKTNPEAAKHLVSLKESWTLYGAIETKKLNSLKKSLAAGNKRDFLDSVSQSLREGTIIELGRTTHRVSTSCEQTVVGILIEGVGEFGQHYFGNNALRQRRKLLLKLAAGHLLKEAIDHFSEVQTSHLALQKKSGACAERAVADQTDIARQIVENYKGFLNRILELGFDDSSDFEEQVKQIELDFEAKKSKLDIQSASHVDNAKALVIDQEMIRKTSVAAEKLVKQFVKIFQELCSKTDEELEERLPQLLSELESLGSGEESDQIISEDVQLTIPLSYHQNDSSSSEESGDDFELLETEEVVSIPYSQQVNERVVRLNSRPSSSITPIKTREVDFISRSAPTSSSRYISRDEGMARKGAGLVNRGNDCFFNAMIQLILNSDLKDFFLNPSHLTSQAHPDRELGPNEARDCQLAFQFLSQLDENYQLALARGGAVVYDHRILRRVLKLDGNNFGSVTQHDCEEAFKSLCHYYNLDFINSEFPLIRRVNLSEKTKIESISKSDPRALEKYSPVDVEGVIQGTELEKSPLQMIHLEKGCRQMQHLVDKIFDRKEDRQEYKFLLESETNPNEWDLYSTQKLTQEIDREKLVLKNHLMLHVQRFAGQGADFRKDQTPLPSDLFEISLGAPPIQYQLIGFAVHQGPSREEGHYVAFIKSQEGWIEWSDTSSHGYSNLEPISSSSSLVASTSSSSGPKSIDQGIIHPFVVENACNAYLLHYKKL